MSLNLRGIKARPHDLDAMMKLKPAMVELHCSVKDLEWIPEKQYNVPLAVHIPEYHDGVLYDPASLDESKRLKAEQIYVQAVRRGVAWALFFGECKPKIVFHPGGMAIDHYDEKQKQLAYSQLSKTIEAMKTAAGDEADILLENMPATGWFYGGEWFCNIVTDCHSQREMCEKHGIGATLDICHLALAANYRNLDGLAEAAHIKDLVKHVHYSDAEGSDGEGLQIGLGTMPVGKYLATVADVDAFACPEIWFGHENGGAGFVKAWGLAEEALTREMVTS